MSERAEAMWLEEARRLERAWRLRFMTSCMQVELPQKPTDILRPLGGMSQMAHLRLFGIHSARDGSGARSARAAVRGARGRGEVAMRLL